MGDRGKKVLKLSTFVIGLYGEQKRAQLPDTFAEMYRTNLMNAVCGVDLGNMSRAIELLLAARAEGRRIFVCGSGSAAVTGAKVLCERMKHSSPRQPMRFRVMMLDDQKPASIKGSVEDEDSEQSFVEQLKTHAEPGDLVVGLSSRQKFLDMLDALEYAEWIGCPTIAITGPGEKGGPKATSRVAIELHNADQGSVEVIQLVLCHMIGRYLQQCEGPH